MAGSAEQTRSSLTAVVVLIAFAAIALSLTQGCAANVVPTPTAEAAVQTGNLDVEHPLNTWVHDDDLPAPGSAVALPSTKRLCEIGC